MADQPGRDFIISYTAVNRPWAEWIAVQLEAAGYTTLLQAWDFRPGSDFIHEKQATSPAGRTIAVLSPAYFGSRFGEAGVPSSLTVRPSRTCRSSLGSRSADTQTAYLLALALDMLREHLVPAAVEHLAADTEAGDCHLTTGFVGVALLCPVLSEHGRADLAYALLHQDTFPSWGILPSPRARPRSGSDGMAGPRSTASSRPAARSPADGSWTAA